MAVLLYHRSDVTTCALPTIWAKGSMFWCLDVMIDQLWGVRCPGIAKSLAMGKYQERPDCLEKLCEMDVAVCADTSAAEAVSMIMISWQWRP